MAPQQLYPLRTEGNEEEGSQAPEALLISAFIETGDFDPDRYHVKDDDVWAWSKLWKFSREYQAYAGSAPPLSLVTKQFPDFELTRDVSAAWAAAKVVEAASMRDMRMRVQGVVRALGEEDLGGALELFDGVQRPRGFRKEPLDPFDHASLTQDFDVTKIEVPWPTLQRCTGGIGRAELWYFAMRLGEGKTWMLNDMAARAAKCGFNVGIASLEMRSKVVSHRIALRLAGNRDQALTRALRSDDLGEQKEALDTIKGLTPGSVSIYDPSHGKINTTNTVHEMCRDFDLVLVD
ncbi:MAG: DnaB-like helicase C-terminal domain-containing protein, partial [Solirubrobacteraceae bacterium]